MQTTPIEVSVRLSPGKNSKEMAATEAGANSIRERQCGPCLLWMSFCRLYRRLLEKIFTFLGQIIASYPCAVICLSLFVIGACCVGFNQWRVENRTEKLFIPQDSEAIRDLNKADEHFRMKVRQEIVLLEARRKGNVLTANCLKVALKIHREIMNLDSYVNLCSTSSGEKAQSSQSCLFINPLEIFDFKNQNVVNVTRKIDRAYKDPTLLMRNGRPLVYNFPRLFGGVWKSSAGKIIGARAIQLIYYMQETENDDVLHWEERFDRKMASLKENVTCGKIRYTAESSVGGAISESIKSGILYVFIGFAIMIIFACTTLCKFENPLASHCLLACAGVLALSLGNLAGFGLASFLGTPFIEMAGIVPFLVLSIGLDDMFIIIRQLDRYRCRVVVDTIKAVMCHSGVFITMTTLTDVVALAVSTTTSVPAIKYFCVYAACSVTLAYMMMMTFFVAFAVFGVRRIRGSCHDCSPCCSATRPVDGAQAWEEPRPQTCNKIMTSWGKCLMFSGTKVMVILLSLGFLGFGIYGAAKIEEGFDLRLLAKSDSHLTEFLQAQHSYFNAPTEVSIVLSEQFDYGKKDNQMGITRLSDIVMKNEHYKNRTVSWFDFFLRFAKKKELNIDSPQNFTSALKTFLKIPIFSLFREDVKLSTDQQHIAASRIIAFMKPSNSSTFKRDAMLSLREDLSSESAIPVFAIRRCFIFFEQYVAIPRKSVQNVLIAAVAILLVALPYLVSVSVVAFVCLGFVAFMFELLGLMYIWGVSLNFFSMIHLVMAIGFYADYNAHIAHAFVTSPKKNGNERVINALETLGPSVFKGGVSAFLGISVSGLATLEIYRIFFRVFFGIIVLSLLHGLCFLPVYLSIMCWQPATVIETMPSNSYSQVDGTSAEMVPMWERGIVIESDYEE